MSELLNENELSEITGGINQKAPYIVYAIKPGDTLSALAVKFKTTVAEIQELNGISNPNIIKVDQEIMLPNNL